MASDTAAWFISVLKQLRTSPYASMQDADLMVEQTEQCREAFSAFDKGKRGSIPVKELREVMRCLGLNPTENEIVAIMADLDLDATGKITLDEFVAVMLDKLRLLDTEDEIRKVFKLFDKDGNGMLNASELKLMMTTMGHQLTDAEVEELIREADINGDGQLNYESTIRILVIQ